MRTEPTAHNRQNVRDAWLSYRWDHAPDAVGPCGHAVRRVRRDDQVGERLLSRRRRVTPGTHPPVCGLATGVYFGGE